MTQPYIGVKQVTAWPAEKEGRPGYTVKYPDGYQSWSPKEIFEAAYLPMGTGSDGSMVNQVMVDNFITRVEAMTVGRKTTVVHATLANGFEIVESSSCVDPKNYDEEIGKQICLQRIKDQVWHMLGFTLQWARRGLKDG